MNSTSKVAVAVAVAVGAGLVAALAFWPEERAPRSEDVTGSATATLTTTQLVALYEEERLAGDVYDDLADRHGSRIFVRIGDAEEQHQSRVAELLEGRGYDLPSLPTEPGDYVTDGYPDAYRDLVRRGSVSLASAYQVGVDIEQMDIADLDELLALTTDPVETRVLTALRSGSQHHLAAFSGGDRGGGARYVAAVGSSRGWGLSADMVPIPWVRDFPRLVCRQGPPDFESGLAT